MKVYEDFNRGLKENKTLEEQALEMTIAYIVDAYDVDIDDIEPIKARHKAHKEWLNEEAQVAEKCPCHKLGKSSNSGMKCSNCGREL